MLDENGSLELKPLHDWFVEFVVSNPEIAFETFRCERMPVASIKKFVTLKEARKRLGLGTAATSRILHSEGIRISRKGSGTATAVPAPALEDIASKIEGRKTLLEVAKELGIGKSRARWLDDFGLLKRIYDPKMMYEKVYVFDPSAARELIQRLSIYIDRNFGDAESALPFSKFFNRATFGALPFSVIISLLAKGKLNPCGRDNARVGFDQLLFAPSHVKTIREEFTNNDTLSLAAAAPILGMNYETLSAMVKSGFLGKNQRAPGQKGRRLSKEEIMAFSEKYVGSELVAARFNTSSKGALKILNERGVKPITGPSSDGNRKYLFRREEVVRVLSANPM